MKRLALFAALLISGCQTTQPGIDVREVLVPTPVVCIDRSVIPVEPARIGDKLTGNAALDLPVIAASALELRKWGQEAVALLQGCARN
jgi:hypothetical protein